MCNGALSSHPLCRRGSVILDLMMRFNQSVIVSNILTFQSDAARQDKFGAFRVDPGSIKQVLIPTDGLESTTQGKYYIRGCKCIPNQFSLSNHFFEKEAKFGPSLI